MSYSELLIELKPLLPSGYQNKILESLDGVKEWHVKHAFTGRTVNEKILRRIFSKAKRLAAQNVRSMERQRKAGKQVAKMKANVA